MNTSPRMESELSLVRLYRRQGPYCEIIYVDREGSSIHIWQELSLLKVSLRYQGYVGIKLGSWGQESTLFCFVCVSRLGGKPLD